MLKIAYCDDREQDRNAIEKALKFIEEGWQETFFVSEFHTGDDLCENLITATYDVILLDILMDGMDGMETARKIRSMGNDSVLVFISSYDEKIRELFQFGTTAFLDKPVDATQLKDILFKTKQEKSRKESTEVFEYKKEGETKQIGLHEIIYLESKRNKIYLHRSHDIIEFTGTLKEVWVQLSLFPQFIMPHKSFVFNLTYATLRSSSVILHTSEIFNVGKKFKEDVDKRFVAYMRNRSK